MSLLVVGTVAFDTIETPHGKVDRIIGGSASYISWAASYFTQSINLVSVIGDDFPEAEISRMEGRGIDTAGLKIIPGQKSFFWEGKYHEDMNKRDTIITDLNVLESFDPKLPEEYRESEFVMLGNLTPSVQMSVIRQMKKRPKFIVADTMNLWINITLDSLMEVVGEVDALIINDEEARMLSGENSLLKACLKIQEWGPRYIVVKKGEHGALLFHENQIFFTPALPLLDVFDPTGAGDTFAGGFMGYIASQKEITFENMKKSVVYGSAMASFCVEDFGLGRLKKITQKEIEQRLNAFRELVTFDL
jgi:sugar/nucleoside kinase (ribokinase family)